MTVSLTRLVTHRQTVHKVSSQSVAVLEVKVYVHFTDSTSDQEGESQEGEGESISSLQTTEQPVIPATGSSPPVVEPSTVVSDENESEVVAPSVPTEPNSDPINSKSTSSY